MGQYTVNNLGSQEQAFKMNELIKPHIKAFRAQETTLGEFIRDATSLAESPTDLYFISQSILTTQLSSITREMLFTDLAMRMRNNERRDDNKL